MAAVTSRSFCPGIVSLRLRNPKTLERSFACPSCMPITPCYDTLSLAAGRVIEGRSRLCCPVSLSGDPSRIPYTHPESRSSLAQLCHTLELRFFEVCVRNLGRPAGLALHGFVSAAVEAFFNGYTRDQVSLQIVLGSAGMREFELGTAGYRLTATEEHYRSKWLDTIYTTLQLLKIVNNEASRSAATADTQLYSTIHHVIEGQNMGDEQNAVNFDRGLATRGASGGVVTEKVVISPQWVPVSQLVLLTMKVVNEAM